MRSRLAIAYKQRAYMEEVRQIAKVAIQSPDLIVLNLYNLIDPDVTNSRKGL